MSNQTVGAIYAQIITDVIDSSRVDFEEMGVDESVLEDLKKVSTMSESQSQAISCCYARVRTAPYSSICCIHVLSAAIS